ncbi:hypothetical protein [Alistipes sp.]|jgi:DNA replication protein DnaC|uniref:hypothetical protein n=1 Tax=unclassified Alistipes TaxID=2608932 RepID=UPI00307F60FB
MSRLFRRKITRVRFRLPMNVAQASNALLAAVQAEVAYRRRTFSMTNALSEQIGRMAAWLTGDSSKFAAVLCGGCGNGKTTFVKAFQNLLCYLNIPVPDGHGKVWGLRLCDAREIAYIVRTDYPAFLTLARTPMLAIDDVGIEPLEVMEYGNVISPVVELLTKRYDEQLFTLMTTNLTPDGIRKRYGDRIADRLNEMAVVIPFKNSSYRTDSASLAE